ncbi:MAG: biopolymer transporter ExbD [Firmicutes bacterium]|jgi:biopolymer transport protein ExbD|nr:biopolymer transporter ExbD [Bacillota bacterium]MDH7496493.1 biopolymer transporter ExbD [Bacillota bacterium]
MVDVMMFLIAFFMLFTTFRSNPAGLTVRLPKAATATPQESAGITVVIDRVGDVYLENRRMTLDSLRQDIEKSVQANPDQFVIIRADSNARYSKLVEVMDAARLAGATRLALAAERKRVEGAQE